MKLPRKTPSKQASSATHHQDGKTAGRRPGGEKSTAAPPRTPARNKTEAERTLRAWFDTQGWSPLPFQRDVWKRYLAGESGLVHTPTGSGKTLAAFGGPLLEALRDDDRALRSAGPKLLWVTPLRALATDTVRALGEPINALGLRWTVGMRTGDATARDKRLARAGKLDALVITPESLARLRALAPAMRTWGLSATLGNLDEARDALLPHAPESAIVSGVLRRGLVIETLMPEVGERFPWAGHLGLSQLPRVVAALAHARSSLLFTNTRAQAELWHRALEAVWPHDPATLALHHGSLDPALRRAAEQGLRDGSIRCAVATSSLDLGVDFPAVDQVLQIGSPKGMSRLLQRAGRARHRPGEAGAIICVPIHALELAEYAAARIALAHGRIEARPPLRLSLDVLAQHCITLALGGGFESEALYAEIIGTHAFAELTRAQWNAVLAFIVEGGNALSNYPEYCRVQRDEDGVYRVHDRRIAMRHRLSIGTITSDGSMAVKFLKGGGLGSVEESFIGRLRPRDRFQFAGRTLELVQIKDMTAYVRLASGGNGVVPRWQGGRMPLSTELGREVESLLSVSVSGTELHSTELHSNELHSNHVPAELRALSPLMALQARLSSRPRPQHLLAEWFQARDGQHLCVFPFAGRGVHEGIAALMALRWGRVAPNTFSYAANDYGLILSAQANTSIDAALLRTLLSPDALLDDLRESVNLGELARRQFREVARVAGLLPPSLPGRAARSLRQLQASSGLLFDVLTRYDPDHLLLQQAEREVLTQQLDLPRLDAALRDCAARTIDLQRPASFTPLSFPLWAEALRGQLSSEDWKTRIQRAAAHLEKKHG